MSLDTEAIEARWFAEGNVHPDVRALLDEVERLREVIGEQRHIVDIGPESFGLQHPIECRPDLLGCPVGAALSALDEPPADVGRYVVTLNDDGYLALERFA